MIDAIQKIFDEFKEAMTIEHGLYVYREPCIAEGLWWCHTFKINEHGDILEYQGWLETDY